MLKDLKIVELAMYLPLPYAGGVFAEMGAKVTKIESPVGGDPLKSFDISAYNYLNAKKEVLYLDLKNENDVKQIYELILDSDVVLNGFRRGFLKNKKLDYETLKEKNSSLIYISLAGYEKGLKDANKAGHDLNFVSLSGIMQNFAEEGRLFLFQLADMAGAFWAVIALFYMLEKRRSFGVGGEIDLSLFRSLLSFFPFFYGAGKGGGIETGIFTGSFACYNIYETKDNRKIAFGCIEKKFFKRALDLLELSYEEDKLYDSSYQEELRDKVRAAIKDKDYDYWMEIFGSEDICITPVLGKEDFYSYLKLQGVNEEALRDFLFSPINY
ncbi:MAG: CaiB/BaiF CoA-transferase family protein [bacterium]